MAFTSKGIDIELKPSPSRPGRRTFDWDTSGPNKGNPKFGNSRAHAVISCLVSWKRGRRRGSKVEEGGTFWDESGQRGTLIWTVTHDTLATGSQLLAYAEDAGRQLVARGIIASLTAVPTRLAPGRWQLDVSWTLPGADKPLTRTLQLG